MNKPFKKNQYLHKIKGYECNFETKKQDYVKKHKNKLHFGEKNGSLICDQCSFIAKPACAFRDNASAYHVHNVI